MKVYTESTFKMYVAGGELFSILFYSEFAHLL